MTDGKPVCRFAVIADTHLEPDPAPGTPDSLRANRRLAAIVEALRADPPDFVIHLGDVVHPLPAIPAYAPAIEAARALLARIPCPLFICPGNHDIGDKPNALAPAAIVQTDWLERFEATFGPGYSSFDHAGCRFVLLNNLLVNTGSPAEAAQEDWLRRTLASAPGRVFLAMHYPLFLRSADEGTTYDAIDEPGRSRLLGIIREHGVEAVFSGHVHIWLHNQAGETGLYGVPSVAFVRRDFSEMFRIGPLAEYGREDPEKLGYLRVDVHDDGHVCHVVRPGQRQRRPAIRRSKRAIGAQGWSGLGVNLRHPWCETVDLPFNPPTDAFLRKRARNDYPALALAELGLRDLRVPLADLEDPTVRERARLLARSGFRFTAFTPGIPDAASIEPLLADLDTLEVVVTADAIGAAIDRLAPALIEARVRLQILPLIPPARDAAERAGRHVIRTGFPPDPDAIRAALAPARRDRLALVAGLQIAIESCDAALLASLGDLEREQGIAAAVLVDWSAVDKDGATTDEAALAREVARVAGLAGKLDGASGPRIFLDTLTGFDRSYYPRPGLIDRRANLTAVGRALLENPADPPA